MKTIGKANIFGTTVQFCDCDICRAFLAAPGHHTAPTVMATVRSEPEDFDREPSAEDLANITE